MKKNVNKMQTTYKFGRFLLQKAKIICKYAYGH